MIINIVQFILTFAIGIALGVIGTWFLSRQKVASLRNEAVIIKERLFSRETDVENLQSEILELKTEIQAKDRQYHDLEQVIASKNIALAEMKVRQSEQQKNFEEKLVLLNGARDQLKAEFHNMASAIMDEKSQKFTTQNRENLDHILSPLRDQLKDFKSKVEDVYTKESESRAALVNEIGHLKELNQQVSQDTVNLTTALKSDSKAQGNWGELKLERVLEMAGLEKGREYALQVPVHDIEGNHFFLDALIRLPQEKSVVVDSKVSLRAFDLFCSSEDDVERAEAMKNHLLSLRNHIKNLSSKKYDQVTEIKSLDYVIMFVPLEGAFIAAIKEDSNLFKEAFDKNIILTCPSTLLSTLRIISFTWRIENQNANTQEIARKAGDLYDKFCGFLNTLQDVGESIRKAGEHYDAAVKTLSSGKGNLIKRAEDIKMLGINSKKSIPQTFIDQCEEPDTRMIASDHIDQTGQDGNNHEKE